MNKKINIIICYMGNLPWYFKYFLHSCAYNPSINFSIITDDQTNRFTIPNNVKIIYSTLSQVQKKCSERIGFEVSLSSGYKLCDFKPAYGLVFSELIEDYDFWGYGDLDVIFGNIRGFITDDLLSDYDVISVRHDFLTGYFQLFKHNDITRNLFRHSVDYQKVFTSDEHYCFDETNFTHDKFTLGVPIADIKCEIDSMMHVVKRLESEGEIKAFFDFFVIEGLPGKLEWNMGALYYKRQYEIMLYHLIMFKEDGFEAKKLKPNIKQFRISPSRIY